MAEPVAKFPCPKCGRMLQASGVLSMGEQTLPTFQCDVCKMNVEFCGERMELPVTFLVDENGRPFDPAAEDGRLRLE